MKLTSGIDHMAEYGPSYEKHIRPFVESIDPKIPFYSSVTGKRHTGAGCLGPTYWRQNMEMPVLFNSSFRAALEKQDGPTILIEVGPHPSLKAPIGQILRDLNRADDVHVGTLERGKACEQSLLTLAGKLFQQGISLQYSVLCPPAKFLNDLPHYSWKRDTTHWAESRVARDWRFREFPPHELLGTRVVEAAYEPSWRNLLALEDASWLSGHEVNGQVVFPAAGYIGSIGEALRQLEGATTYSLRNVTFAAAMVLEHDKTIEILTQMRPLTKDPSDQTPWFAFTIASYDGTKWVRHCVGEARASMDDSVSLESADLIHTLPRKVDATGWYGLMDRIGFKYTGPFRGLQSISAATNRSQAAATVATQQVGHSTSYSLHPAMLDQCFQLYMVAAYRGLSRNCRDVAVPTYIEEITITPTAADIRAAVSMTKVDRGSFTGDLTAQHAQQSVLSIKGFKASAIRNSDAAVKDLPLITQFEWRPHSAFVDLNQYMEPRQHCPKEWPLLEELILLCILENQESLTITDKTPPHLAKYLEWQKAHLQHYKSGLNAFVPQHLRLWEMDIEQRTTRIDSLVAEVSISPYAVFSTAIIRLFKASPSIFTDETHPLHVLLEDNVLNEFYRVADALDFGGLIKILAHTNPHIRILEVGAGTGGTTAQILRNLRSSQGERLYSNYTYTDVSAGFMAKAKEQFGTDKIEYSILDITQDPLGQGFQPGSFDLIIGANVVHATPCLQETLRHLRSLLSPSGRLFLQELCPDAKFVDYVMGFLPGWWLGAEDNRVEQPYISPSRWSKELASAGFKEPDAVILDGIGPYHMSAGILASVAVDEAALSRVTLLCHDPEGAYVQETVHYLEQMAVEVDIRCFGQDCPPSQDVISLLDLQQPTVHGVSEGSLMTLFSHLKAADAKMIWATQCAQVVCEDPRAAMILGLARTARSEFAVKLFTVEIDSSTSASKVSESLVNILLKINSPTTEHPTLDPDYEYAVVNNQINVPRLHWQTVSEAFSQSADTKAADQKHVTVSTPGLLHTMEWTEQRLGDLMVGEVLVETKAVGLNFRVRICSFLSIPKYSSLTMPGRSCGSWHS